MDWLDGLSDEEKKQLWKDVCDEVIVFLNLGWCQHHRFEHKNESIDLPAAAALIDQSRTDDFRCCAGGAMELAVYSKFGNWKLEWENWKQIGDVYNDMCRVFVDEAFNHIRTDFKSVADYNDYHAKSVEDVIGVLQRMRERRMEYDADQRSVLAVR